jgi:hypothetical protein
MGPKLSEKNISIIFVQIAEAHSTAWPIGHNVPIVEPHRDIGERFDRARLFADKYFGSNIQKPFTLLVDTWSNTFDQIFQSWPDKFYLIDQDKTLLSTSTYGDKQDALINQDYSEILFTMLNQD